uniref:DNA2/NAM7 helicase-like C-terminal domain-containing protein n=1 Tax=Panagrolaimus sp. ES5 TaxID=591445 RepID=A0AC34FXR2_9BILA
FRGQPARNEEIVGFKNPMQVSDRQAGVNKGGIKEKVPLQGFGYLSPQEDARRRKELLKKKEEGINLEDKDVDDRDVNLDSRKRQAEGKVVEGQEYRVAAGAAPSKQPRKELLKADEIEFEEPVRYVVIADQPGQNMILMREDDETREQQSVSNPPAFLRFSGRTFIRDQEGYPVAPKIAKIGLLDTVLVYGIQIKMSAGIVKENLSDTSTDKNFCRVFQGKQEGYKVRANLAFATAVAKVKEGPAIFIPALIRWVSGEGADTYVYFLAANEEEEQRVHGRTCDWVNGRMEPRSLGEVYVAVVPEGWTKLTSYMTVPAVLVGHAASDGGLMFRSIRMMGNARREWIGRGMAIMDREDARMAEYFWHARLMVQQKMVQRELDYCNTPAELSAVTDQLVEQCRVCVKLPSIDTSTENYAGWVEHFKLGKGIGLSNTVSDTIKASITAVLFDDEGTLTTLGLWLEDEEYQRFYDEIVVKRMWQVRIVMDLRTGLESRLKAFRNLPRVPAHTRKIVNSFYGLYRATAEIEPLPPRALSHLNEGQRLMGTLMHQDGEKFPFIFLQAGPGTGKTGAEVASAIYESKFLEEGKVVMLTATTNLATMNLLEKLEEAGEKVMKKVLYLQSQTAEVIHGALTEKREWKKARVAERLQEIISKPGELPFTADDLEFVKAYVAKRIHHDGESYQEQRAIELLMRMNQYKIVVVTTNSLVQIGAVVTALVKKLFIDEGGLVTCQELLAMFTSCCNAVQVVVAGDVNQMTPYTPKTCSRVEELCDSDSAIQRIFSNGRDNASVELDLTYRAHPILGQIISEAFYDGKLRSGISASDRTLVTDNVNLPAEGVPLILLDVTEDHQSGQGFSLSNPAQERIAAKLVKKVMALKKGLKITVICFYKSAIIGMQRELAVLGITSITVNGEVERKEEKGKKLVELSTIDSYQGKEEDLIIILTTRSSDHRIDLDGSHLGKSGRAIVAATRAKHGMVVIGNMAYLKSLTVWQKYLTVAAKFTPTVDRRYVEALENDMAPTRKGTIWVDLNGKPAFAATFQIDLSWAKEYIEPPTFEIKELKLAEKSGAGESDEHGDGSSRKGQKEEENEVRMKSTSTSSTRSSCGEEEKEDNGTNGTLEAESK